MFAGHYGVALAAKSADRTLSLGLLFVAVQLPDFLWTVLNLAGIERTEIDPGITATSPLTFTYYPYSHSLLTAVVLAVITYVIMRWILRPRAALMVALAVFSHWILDFLSHRPDLPLAGGESAKVGLGMWNHPAAAIIVESLIVIGGLVLYLRASRGEGFAGRYGMVILMFIILGFTIMGMVGGAPPSMNMVAASGLVMYTLIAALGGWLGKKRVAKA